MRFAWRDWRAGELNLMLAALVVAVAAIASVGFVVDRMRVALERQAADLIGADLVIRSERPIPEGLVERARASGLRVAQTVVFPSMAAGPARPQLASVKAVSSLYPLRGRVRVSERLGSDVDAPATAAPAPGDAWADAQLLRGLGLAVGDRVELGERTFRIRRVITLEPDRGAGFVNFAPRLMIPLDDLAATGLVQPASRVTYRLLVAGEPSVVASYRGFVEASKAIGLRVEALDSGRPELRATVDRADQFLSLVALLSALIAAVAVALAARRFAQRHLDACAVIKAIGVTQGRLLAILGVELALIALVGGTLGAAAGWLVHAALVGALGSLVTVALPAASFAPAFRALVAAFVLVLGFGAWPFVRLSGVPPLRVIRREIGDLGSPAMAGGSAVAVLSFAALLFWFAGDRRLALYALAGFAIGAIAFAGGGLGLVALVGRFRGTRILAGHAAMRLALASWSRRRAAAVAQTVALAIGMMALLLLTVTRTDLIEGWRRASPPDAPNRFIVNIQPEQREPVTQMLRAAGIVEPHLYPMVRGRLVSVNDRPLDSAAQDDERARRTLDRELNLSYATTMPTHNRLVAGRWLDPARDEVSVEEGVAQSLGIRVGDRIAFDIAGERVRVEVVGVRKVAWDSLQVNFFMILSPRALERMPQTLITAYHQPASAQPAEPGLVERFPNLTVFDMGNIVRQVQSMLDQVVRAIQILFLLTLAAGVAVLYGALASSRDERTREAGLMRAVGASRRQLMMAQLIEIGASGALAGVMAAFGALALGGVLAEQVFRFALPLRWEVVPLAALAGAVLAVLAGWMGLREVFRTPPLVTLRDA